jgi:hypothetical protein
MVCLTVALISSVTTTKSRSSSVVTSVTQSTCQHYPLAISSSCPPISGTKDQPNPAPATACIEELHRMLHILNNRERRSSSEPPPQHTSTPTSTIISSDFLQTEHSLSNIHDQDPQVAPNLPLFQVQKTWTYGKWWSGLTKVSFGPAMLYPSTPCGRATPQTALQPFQGWLARRVGGMRPSSTPWTPLAVRL